MDFDFVFMLKAMAEAGTAIPYSLLIAFSAVLAGMVLGLPIALVRFYRVPVVCTAAAIWITIAKALPNILVYFILFALLAQERSFPVALITIIGITVATSTEMSEMFRGALESIDKSQFDAARSIGHGEADLFFRVALPQMVPVCVPVASGVVIHAIKALPVAVLIGLRDILNTALGAAVVNYRYLESYVAAALIFWAIFIVVEKSFLLVEKRFRYNSPKGGV
ncbi:MAG: ABC transporter permease subunit [Spirochaetaceae bacterium]|jgi:L-cystine transport system permease protein|nr:ABC transporter permease subunit [Spirochaetaceae bacterium]